MLHSLLSYSLYAFTLLNLFKKLGGFWLGVFMIFPFPFPTLPPSPTLPHQLHYHHPNQHRLTTVILTKSPVPPTPPTITRKTTSPTKFNSTVLKATTTSIKTHLLAGIPKTPNQQPEKPTLNQPPDLRQRGERKKKIYLKWRGREQRHKDG